MAQHGKSIFSKLFASALFIQLLGTPHACAQSSLSGYWDLRIPQPANDGTYRDMYLHLEQGGNAVTGELIRHPQGVPVTGTLQGAHLHLTTVPPPPPSGHPARQPLTFDGTYEQEKLKLVVRGEDAEEHAIGEQVTREATMPPAPLPLETLKDVPDNGLARTPPMGWNSWNKFAEHVDDAAVRGMADAMVSSGMRDAGYKYINIDDTWELGRDANGNIIPNKKFPDMKALADYVHSKGLKIGIYSSPGPKTCADYEGSFGHVQQDAKTYAAWGIDYLKYDLCSDLDVYKDDAPTLQAIYQEMGEALQATGRPIVYSLCEYGRAQVWTGWGARSGGNLWRTTGDISDNWDSMNRIGFSQIKLASYARAGHWNDPDMLEIGNGGMTADEYRTHMSLWSLLAAPLIAGNDLRTMTPETKDILMNRDVIAIDQDADYKPVISVSSNENIEVLMRPLHDGSVVVGLFNRSATAATITFRRSSLPAQFTGHPLAARDLWEHETVAFAGDTFQANVPSHGVVLLSIRAR